MFHFTDLFFSLNKDDNSHPSGACFHILILSCSITFNKVLYFTMYYVVL